MCETNVFFCLRCNESETFPLPHSSPLHQSAQSNFKLSWIFSVHQQATSELFSCFCFRASGDSCTCCYHSVQIRVRTFLLRFLKINSNGDDKIQQVLDDECLFFSLKMEVSKEMLLSTFAFTTNNCTLVSSDMVYCHLCAATFFSWLFFFSKRRMFGALQ